MNRRKPFVTTGLLLLALCVAGPVLAQEVVFDPGNFAESVLIAARELQQVTNQITSLQNEARMLTNQARNLASLPYSSLEQLQTSLRRTQALLGQAQNIGYDVQRIDRAFATAYGAAVPGQSDQALVAGAEQRWRNSVTALQDAMRVQAGVVGNLDTDRDQTASLVTASQSATGALKVAQAGNQLLALQSGQIADLTAAVVAQGRAQSLNAAQQAAAVDQAHEQLRRFLAPGPGYLPAPVSMFAP